MNRLGGLSKRKARIRNETETDEPKITEQIASLIGCIIVQVSRSFVKGCILLYKFQEVL